MVIGLLRNIDPELTERFVNYEKNKEIAAMLVQRLIWTSTNEYTSELKSLKIHTTEWGKAVKELLRDPALREESRAAEEEILKKNTKPASLASIKMCNNCGVEKRHYVLKCKGSCEFCPTCAQMYSEFNDG